MVKRPKWFPWLELITLVVCGPVLWMIVRLFATKYQVHEQLIFRRLPAPVGLLSAILSFYVVIRLGSITRWFALAFPIFWVLLYATFAAIGALVWRLY